MTVEGALDQLSGRRILFLNWRDRRHPRAGGAEVHCHSLAESFTQSGAEVTLFTAVHRNAANREIEDGTTIIRRGGQWTVYARAAMFLLRSRSRYDAVVDVQNGIPFFAPLFLGRRTPVVGVIHHVHQRQFALYLSKLQSSIARTLEGPVSRLVYRDTPIIVVSPSTRDAVRRKLRFSSPLFVVPNGQEPKGPPASRSARPTITFVGRLVPHKRLDHLLDSVARLMPLWDDLVVNICGSGPAEADLRDHSARLGLDDVVTFHGFVPDDARDQLVSQSWLTVASSTGEGWGLTVMESNALGVPTVAYNVVGLRDSVVDHETGWLVADDPDALTDGIDNALYLLSDQETAAGFSMRCQAWAALFSWNRSAEWTARILVAEMARVASGHRSRSGPRDLNVVASFDSADPVGTTQLVSRILRSTDDCVSDGERFRVLLRGCDELDALAGLQRLGIDGAVDVRLATSVDLLVGAAGFEG